MYYNTFVFMTVSAFELQRNTGTSSSMTGRNMNEYVNIYLLILNLFIQTLNHK